MTSNNFFLKRTFDLSLALPGITLVSPLILVLWVISSIETNENGMFVQSRVGRNGNIFRIFKIRTMRSNTNIQTSVTTSTDNRISKFGKVMRRWKLDELPQLWNVVIGKMSFVGPRPDVPGFADKLVGDDREVLKMTPGITGLATIYYHNEEMLLASVESPEEYNKNVIWPNKVKLNRLYYANYSVFLDLRIIWYTLTKKGSFDSYFQDCTLIKGTNQF